MKMNLGNTNRLSRKKALLTIGLTKTVEWIFMQLIGFQAKLFKQA